MDLDFRVILEQPTRKEQPVSADVQLTAAYIRAMSQGDLRQAHKILEEKTLIHEAERIRQEDETTAIEDAEQAEKLTLVSSLLLENLEQVKTASVETLEDTLELRRELFKMVSANNSLPARRFVVANNYLEDAVIENSNTNAPLVMIIEALRDLSSTQE